MPWNEPVCHGITYRNKLTGTPFRVLDVGSMVSMEDGDGHRFSAPIEVVERALWADVIEPSEVYRR